MSIARVRDFNGPQVYKFFDLLETEIYTCLSRIYHMDETGIQTSNKPSKIFKKIILININLKSGKRKINYHHLLLQQRWIFHTHMYGRKIIFTRLLDRGPHVTNATCTENSWINGPNFKNGLFISSKLSVQFRRKKWKATGKTRNLKDLSSTLKTIEKIASVPSEEEWTKRGDCEVSCNVCEDFGNCFIFFNKFDLFY